MIGLSSLKNFVLGSGILFASVATQAQADCGTSVAAPGKVFYVIPEGDLVTREVTLTVPACGEGAVSISSSSGWHRETTTFFSRKVAGKTTFVVVFKDPKGDNPNKYLTFIGSYLRGKNLAKYWGDLYTLTLPENIASAPQAFQQMFDAGILLHYGQHAGGFGFKAEVPAETPPTPQDPQAMLFQ